MCGCINAILGMCLFVCLRVCVSVSCVCLACDRISEHMCTLGRDQPANGVLMHTSLCVCLLFSLLFALLLLLACLSVTTVLRTGLFRLSGSQKCIERMKADFDAGSPNAGNWLKYPNTGASEVAGLLKLYVRELPEPLLTHRAYSHFKQSHMKYAEKTISLEEHLNNIREQVSNLPTRVRLQRVAKRERVAEGEWQRGREGEAEREREAETERKRGRRRESERREWLVLYFGFLRG
jgi:RhoGAP domain